MKACLILAMCIMIGCVGGCNGMNVKGTMGAQMDLDTTKAVPVQTQVAAGTLTPAAARAYIPVASTALNTYYTAATTNPFAFWFGGNTILADATIFMDLRRDKVDATECAKRATTTSDALAVENAGNLATMIIEFDHMKGGVK